MTCRWTFAVSAIALGVVGCLISCGGGGGGNSGSGGDSGGTGHADLPLAANRPLAEPLRGVTTEAIEPLDEIFRSISSHSVAPTVRLVFQPDRTVADYGPAIQRLRPTAYLVGELVDSDALASFTTEQVRQRASDFYAAYGDQIDLWEIGNELNGEWAGSGPDEINAKVQAAYNVIKKEHGARTMVTLNYWSGPDCYAQPWEPTLTYAAGMPAEIREGVDYVTLSVYETACNPRQEPTAEDLAAALNGLATLFPNAKLAIGETGAQRASDGVAEPDLAEKQRIARKYYGMHASLKRLVGSRFVGGYFWWYYGDDAVPKGATNSLWPTLETLLSGL